MNSLNLCRFAFQALEDLSLQYDSSVRNSENTIVQLVYGDDGLHPDKMENNDRPVDLTRLRLHVVETSPCREERALASEELVSIVDEKLSEKRFQRLLPTGRVFLQELRDYFADLANQRAELVKEGLTEEAIAVKSWNTCRVTATQLEMILSTALEKCLYAFVEPGEAVGAIGAQSISEPGTQMTLKVRFDFGDNKKL